MVIPLLANQDLTPMLIALTDSQTGMVKCLGRGFFEGGEFEEVRY